MTAGVYQPVKKDSNYYAVKERWEAGQSVEEIMQALSLSKAAVNAFLPYERGGKNLDQLGVTITLILKDLWMTQSVASFCMRILLIQIRYLIILWETEERKFKEVISLNKYIITLMIFVIRQ